MTFGETREVNYMITPTFNIKQEEAEEKYGKFVIEPLEQGYGHTLGSSLRRVLLSSLSGSAVTQVAVAGLKHQFDSIKGVKEDGVDLLLNLKKLRVKYNGEKPAKLSLVASKEGEVTAAQIDAPSDVEIANPELLIATLSNGAKLDIDIQVERGVGYSSSEERKTNKIGLIPLDADFSPISRVNYKVEETRVGRLTNYDKLTIEIWTDGTMEAQDALTQASQILVTYFGRVSSPVQTAEVLPADATSRIANARANSLSIEELGLPTRIANALFKAGYESVTDLIAADKSDVAKVRNMGDKSIKVIETALREKGISWEK